MRPGVVATSLAWVLVVLVVGLSVATVAGELRNVRSSTRQSV